MQKVYNDFMSQLFGRSMVRRVRGTIYKPHQGEQEKARRVKQMANGHALNSHKPEYQPTYRSYPRKHV